MEVKQIYVQYHNSILETLAFTIAYALTKTCECNLSETARNMLVSFRSGTVNVIYDECEIDFSYPRHTHQDNGSLQIRLAEPYATSCRITEEMP